jgi:tetratricopeptide (TPR) repeat protein
VRGRINLADGLRTSGAFAEALEQDRAALAALSGGVGVENLYGAHARFGAGLDLVGLGRLSDAREPLEQAIATLERIGGDAGALARARFGLARSLWRDPGARARARELAAAALAALEGASGADARLRAIVASWLDARSR